MEDLLKRPSVGRIVLYRSRTGYYTVPAIVTATASSLAPAGVSAGYVPALSDGDNVHLTVFTPGKPGMRDGAGDFLCESEHGRSENVAGCYQEWDIPPAHALSNEQNAEPGNEGFPPGTWAWPQRV